VSPAAYVLASTAALPASEKAAEYPIGAARIHHIASYKTTVCKLRRIYESAIGISTRSKDFLEPFLSQTWSFAHENPLIVSLHKVIWVNDSSIIDY
jgi:hypothetical protein